MNPRDRNTPRRLLIRLGLLVAVGIGLCIGLLGYLEWRERREWADACAEADRLDPDWRWEELAAKQPTMPAERNLATHVGVVARLPANAPVPRNGKYLVDLEGTLPQHRLDPGVVADITEVLGVSRTLSETAPLSGYSAGTIPLPMGNPLKRDYASLFQAHSAVNCVLYPRLALSAEQGDADGALDQVRIILCTGRPPADFPSRVTNLEAVRVRAGAARGVERVLAQGEPSSDALFKIRQLMASEAGRASLLPALRGERAWFEELIRGLGNGQVNRDELARYGIFAEARDGKTWSRADQQLAWLTGADVRRASATALLRYYNHLIEWLKESPDGLEIHKAERLAARAMLPSGAAEFTSFHGQVLAEVRGSDAQVRCAVAALAAEQCRRENGRWPAALGELVPKYLSAVPLDPYDLQPIRLARRPDGIVIYCIGVDRIDDGGAIASDGAARAGDVGIRLWDVDKRRQPALPPQPPKQRPRAIWVPIPR